MESRRRIRVLGAGTVALALLAAGCSGAGGSSGTPAAGGDTGSSSSSGGTTKGQSINVLMVGNPQMEDLQKLTKDAFTAKTGIGVNFTILPENELRDKVTQDIATKAGQYDVATIGAYEANVWADNDWLTPLNDYTKKDTAFDSADLLKPMVESLTVKDNLYALPFYGESSFLMYRKDLFQAAGITMPEHPTWDQVAGYAKQLDGKNGVSGICLRGLAGWGEVFAPLTTVVNTYGGTWFDKDWNAKVNAPEFKKATQFYVDLVKNYGEDGAAQAGFTECLNNLSQGKTAMWYDATSAAGSLEDPKTSKVAGKIGYAFAPTGTLKKNSGWLWNWAWGMPKTTKKADAAYKFMSWASSKDYEKLVGDKLGYSRVPSGKRASTYELPAYQKAASAFYKVTLDSIQQADPVNPGAQPRPTTGIQFVAIPDFADLGTKVAQEVSAAIAGRTTVDKALDDGQKLAEAVGKDQK